MHRTAPPQSLSLVLGACVAISASFAAAAGRPAEAVFPEETVGFLLVTSVPEFRERWSKTQLGQLSEEPAMQPFLEQLGKQLEGKVGRIEERLGVTLEDFNSAASGEAAVGLVGPAGQRKRASVAVLIDATGRDAEAKSLVEKIEKHIASRNGKPVGGSGGPILVYSVPAKKAGQPPQTVAYFQAEGRLGAADDESVARAMHDRLTGKGSAPLSGRKSYAAVLSKVRKEARGLAPQIVWYVSPFDYDTASRTLDTASADPDKKDNVTILREQGFDAITGVGGHVALALDPQRDIAHHTSIYAPAKQGAKGKRAADKYNLAMRMAEFPNAKSPITVAPWAPRSVASYKTLSVDLQNAFDHVGSLFDAFAGYKDAFQTTMDNFEKDPYGPQINLRKDIVAHLGQRVTIMTDYTLPITSDSERYLMVFDVVKPEAIAEPLAEWMKNDQAQLRELRGVAYWELLPEDETLTSADVDAGLLPLDGSEPAASDDETPREQRVLRRAAVCLHEGRLAIASDAEFLGSALFGVSSGEALAEAADVAATSAALDSLAPAARCAWTFTRTDESVRPSYELVRAGKMPEAETFFGQLLNRMLTTDEEKEVGAQRRQKIDGSTLPSFEMARRYFGPAARAVRSDDDGWLITGVVLSKAAE
ncbi:MAG: hypothetical protein ACRCT8_10370 [Lacipirellulaceae bacterium]